MVIAPLMAVGGVIMAYRQDGPLSLLLVVIVPVHGARSSAASWCRRSRCSGPCRSRSTDQPDPAREPHRHPGDPRVRAHRARGAAVRGGQRRPDRHDAARQPHLRPDDAGPHAHHEPVERGRGLVRRAPDRLGRHAGGQPDGLPGLPDADPDVGDDGHDGAGDVAAGGRVVRAAQRGAGRRAPSTTRVPRSRRAALRGTVEFRDVEFGYPGAAEPVLRGVSFTALPGRRPPSSAPPAPGSPR